MAAIYSNGGKKKLLARTIVSKESLCSSAYHSRVAYHVQLGEIAEICGRSDTATPAALASHL
jgi:hypothetical protein